MRRALAHRLASVALLAAWPAPAALGLAIDLHLVLHHGAPALGWALAVEHGHSHADADPEHGHPGTRAETPRAPHDPLDAVAAGERPPAPASCEPAAAPGPSPPLRPPRRGLYTLHCALLC